MKLLSENTYMTLKVIPKLGYINLIRVLNYKLKLKFGLFRQLTTTKYKSSADLISKNDNQFTFTTKIFGWSEYKLTSDPKWHQSTLNSKFNIDSKIPWHDSYLAIPKGRDIKEFWELNRFYWLTELTYQYKISSDEDYLSLARDLVKNWTINNPPFFGVNWACAQEAAIRIIHIVSSIISINDYDSLDENLINLLEIHLQRIEPTISYSIAQDNNHGTSEAAALFIGGAILNANKTKKRYLKWMSLGEKWLINRANKIIMADGGTSQYSTNYHRVILDTYCVVEIVRLKLHLKPFPKNVYVKLGKATDWLYTLVQDNGDTPNLGANDGARLLSIGGTDYRDYRPTVQLSSTLFCKRTYYEQSGSFDQCLLFFNLEKVENCSKLPSKSRFFKHSGLMTKEAGNFFICFKIPKFKFRPSQCDALHLDLWFKGENVLRDGGTFSYNTTTDDLDYYSGVESHNTVQFDNHLQMPRLSRFLFASWLKPLTVKYRKNTLSSSYKDAWNCQHSRSINVQKKQLVVTDEVKGFKDHAVLRWRLMPDQWVLKENILSNGKMTLEIHSKSALKIRMVEGRESRYYYQETNVPVLEVTAIEPTTIHTTIKDIT